MPHCYGLLIDPVTRRARFAWWWAVEGEDCPTELSLDEDTLVVHMEGAVTLAQFDVLRRRLHTLGLPVESEPALVALGAELIPLRLADLPPVAPGRVRGYLPGFRGVYDRPARSWEEEWDDWQLNGRQGPEPTPRVVVRTERREFPDGSVETRTVRDFPHHVKVRQFPRRVVTTPGPGG